MVMYSYIYIYIITYGAISICVRFPHRFIVFIRGFPYPYVYIILEFLYKFLYIYIYIEILRKKMTARFFLKISRATPSPY